MPKALNTSSIRGRQTDPATPIRRSIWLQLYFESGCPYATDQWIAAVGTSWAAIALLLTVDARSTTRDLRPTGEAGRDRVLHFSWPTEAPHTAT
jgi:hypothetical protein